MRKTVLEYFAPRARRYIPIQSHATAYCARNLLAYSWQIASHAEKPMTSSEFIAHYARKITEYLKYCGWKSQNGSCITRKKSDTIKGTQTSFPDFSVGLPAKPTHTRSRQHNTDDRIILVNGPCSIFRTSHPQRFSPYHANSQINQDLHAQNSNTGLLLPQMTVLSSAVLLRRSISQCSYACACTSSDTVLACSLPSAAPLSCSIFNSSTAWLHAMNR